MALWASSLMRAIFFSSLFYLPFPYMNRRMTTGNLFFFVGLPTVSSTHLPSPRQVIPSPADTGLSGF